MFVTIVAEVTAPPSTLPQPAHLPDEIYHPQALEQVACPISRGSARPRNRTGVSCIAGGFFTNIRALKKVMMVQPISTESPHMPGIVLRGSPS